MALIKELAAYFAETSEPKGEWFKRLTPAQKREYLKAHPDQDDRPRFELKNGKMVYMGTKAVADGQPETKAKKD